MKRALALLALLLCGCDDRPLFTREEINAANLGAGLPSGFLMGAATAAHQIEGGNQNDWTDWELGHFPDGKPHIIDGSNSSKADESWTRFGQDLAALQALGANAYRFSIEWSRIEPEPGVWRDDVVAQYRSWLTALRAGGITPMVTLYHFTLPRWVAAQGGWENPSTAEALARFSGRVAQALGAEVDLWCTINEPNVLAAQGYMQGVWPPGKQSTSLTAQVLTQLMRAHALSAAAIRAADTVDADGDGAATKIGLAHHVRVFQAASSGALDQAIAGFGDAFFNQSIVDALHTGRVRVSIPPDVSVDEAVEGLAGSADFLGINYYTRDYLRANLGSASFYDQYTKPNRPTNDLGWDLYPEGLYTFLRRYSTYGWPLYVTENGIADAEGDRRSESLRAHVYALERAVQDGVDVRGYLHWSLMDNFEWAEGFTGRFGLFRVDFDDPGLIRVATPAVPVFREVAERIP